MTSYNVKLKILAIHGYRQSDKIFSAKLGSLRKNFKREVDFVFVKAPHKVPAVEGHSDSEQYNDDTEDIADQYGWWFNTVNKVFKATEPSHLSVGFDESVQLIKKTFEEQGPFDGLIGFSQGGSFVSILCAMQQKEDMAIELSNFFMNKETFVHEGGHYVPGKKHIYSNFIKQMLEIKTNKNKNS